MNILDSVTSVEGRMFSLRTFIIAVVTACVGALVLGFLSGYLFSRHCRQDTYEGPYIDTAIYDSKLYATPRLV